MQENAPKKVLIVDDDATLTEFVEIYMNRFGYQCASLNDPSRVIKWLHRFPCDLLILDLHMPELDGLSLLKEVKAVFPKLPVVMFSGQICDEKQEADMLEAGASCFVKKGTHAVEIFSSFMGALAEKEAKC